MTCCFMSEDMLKLIQLALAVIGGGWALWIYSRDMKRRRAEWLTSLHKKFYEEPQYKRIRYLLDYKPAEYHELREMVEGAGEDPRIEELVDYLNFLEFVGSLWERRQLSMKDIRTLFDYYLRNLKEHTWVRRYIEKKANGFEKLVILLRKLPERMDA